MWQIERREQVRIRGREPSRRFWRRVMAEGQGIGHAGDKMGREERLEAADGVGVFACHVKAAYLRLDKTALDSLAMKKMLMLAQEMGVILLIMEKEAQTYLWVARCLQAHESMHQSLRVVAWADEPVFGKASTVRSAESEN
ncbi:unnamed protein product [Lampetra planeri]